MNDDRQECVRRQSPPGIVPRRVEEMVTRWELYKWSWGLLVGRAGAMVVPDGQRVNICLLFFRGGEKYWGFCIKKQRYYFPDKGLYSQSYSFSSSHVWIWQLDHKEGWMPKNWCFWTMVLEKTLESPLDCKEIPPVNPKGNKSWIFIRRTDAEAPTLWTPDAKRQFIRKDPDSGKDLR